MGSREHHSAATSHLITMDMAANSTWSSCTRLPMSEHTNWSSSSSWASGRPPAAKKVFSIMAMSAPLLYLSLLHVPPYSSLLGDTKFWFLVSNAIILVLAAEYSGMFDSASDVGPTGAYLDEEEYYYATHSRVCPVQEYPPRSTSPVPELTAHVHLQAPLQLVPVAGAAGDEEGAAPSSKVIGRRPRRSASELGARRGHGGKRTCKEVVLLRKSKTEKYMSGGHAVPEEADQESEYLTMSDEELNRRVEEFIRKFNMEIRRQDSIGDRPEHM